MKITAVESHHIAVPFSTGADKIVFAGESWQRMNTLFLRIVTDAGLEGWGEGFGHACCPATRAVIDTQLAPLLLGQDARDIAGLNRRVAQALHLFGRNGPHLYGRSAMDVALWDIAGKAAGLPLWRLLGATPPAAPTPAYASLLRYGAPTEVARAAARARAEGYADLKLHEITVAAVQAARDAAGPAAALMVDTNCPWSPDDAIAMGRAMRPSNLTWLEEPVWPPEDFQGLARVRRESGQTIAAGENAAGVLDFRNAFACNALDIAQPSVAKIGGVSDVMQIATLAQAAGVRVIPHCAYFGPGFLASLHLHARIAPHEPFERLFVDLEASPYHDLVLARNGCVSVPDGPGLGADPDPAVLARYALSAPTVIRSK